VDVVKRPNQVPIVIFRVSKDVCGLPSLCWKTASFRFAVDVVRIVSWSQKSAPSFEFYEICYVYTSYT